MAEAGKKSRDPENLWSRIAGWEKALLVMVSLPTSPCWPELVTGV
jgi:hypothetical protein